MKQKTKESGEENSSFWKKVSSSCSSWREYRRNKLYLSLGRSRRTENAHFNFSIENLLSYSEEEGESLVWWRNEKEKKAESCRNPSETFSTHVIFLLSLGCFLKPWRNEVYIHLTVWEKKNSFLSFFLSMSLLYWYIYQRLLLSVSLSISSSIYLSLCLDFYLVNTTPL